MDWNTLYCPNKGCRYYGIPFQPGKIVKNGSSYGQPQALCKGCGGSVALSYATAYYGLESEPAIFETTVRAWRKEIPSAHRAVPYKLTPILEYSTFYRPEKRRL